MNAGEAALLLGAAVVGGALNAVAGGGSFFTFPALVFVGIPVVPANATSTLALWPGSLAAALGYRRELRGDRKTLAWLTLPSLLGGGAGALLLVHTPSAAFERLVPFLLLAATLLFAFGPKLVRWALAGRQAPRFPLGVGMGVQLAVSVYGGYFGGGMGMMMLAAFALLGQDDVHRMNGLKALLAVAINVVSLLIFVLAGIIAWRHGLLMTVGAGVGGYGGASLARRMDPRWIRAVIIASGASLTLVFFARAYA